MKAFNYENLYSRGNADRSLIGCKGFFGWDFEAINFFNYCSWMDDSPCRQLVKI